MTGAACRGQQQPVALDGGGGSGSGGVVILTEYYMGIAV